MIQRASCEELKQEFKEQKQENYSVLDNITEGCQIIGFDWRYLYVNDTAARQGRQTKENLLGRTMMEVHRSIEKTKMFGVLRRCIEERKPTHMDNEFTYPDGSKGWFELSIQPVPEGIFILSIDITERKRVEEALRESEEKYRELFENESDAVMIFDEETLRFEDANRADLTGFRRQCQRKQQTPVF